MTDSLWPDDSESRPGGEVPAGDLEDPIAAFLADIWEESKDEPLAAIVDPQPTEPAAGAGFAAVAETTPESSGSEAAAESDESAAIGTPGAPAVVVAAASASGHAQEAAPVADTGSSELPDAPSAPLRAPFLPLGPGFDDQFGSFEPEDPPAGSARRRSIFVVAGSLLAIAAVALVWVGVKVVLGSSDGKLVTRIDDRAAPGFEAIVEKTQTGLVLMVDDDGTLTSATVVALGSETTGGVLSIPVETDVYVSLSPGLAAPVALVDLVNSSGTDAAATALGELLNLGFTDIMVLRPSDLAARIPSTLTVNNPAAVTDADGTVVFAKGSITLPAGDLWRYISSTSPSEEPAVHAARQEAFWKAWLAAGDPAGEGGAGIDAYLDALAADQVTYQTLPISEVAAVDGSPTRFRLAPGVTGAAAVAPIVPLPEGAPGRRPRLRVVDGTGQLDAAQGAALVLAAGGGQVDIIGNSRLFGFIKTQIVYYDEAQKVAAEKMREVLGVGEIVQSTQTNSALDLTITMGEDLSLIHI